MANRELMQALQAAQERAERSGYSDDQRVNSTVRLNVRAFQWCLQFGSTPAEVEVSAQEFLTRLNELYGAEVQS